MEYIFLTCGLIVGFLLGVLVIGKTTIGDLIIVDDDGEGFVFLELNDHDSINKAKSKRYIRMKVVKRKNYK